MERLSRINVTLPAFRSTRRRVLAFCTFGLLLTCGRDLRSETADFLADFGIEYQLKELSVPRTNRVHVLRVDMSKNRVRPAVVVAPDPDGAGPAEAVLMNPLKLAAGPQTLAFINANPWCSLPDEAGKKNRDWFEGQAVDINGLAVSSGVVRSPVGKECVPVRMTAEGKVFIGAEGAEASVLEGLAGWQQIVKEGKNVAPPSAALAPRTALGIDQESSVLWLVVVDGRQDGYSEGMSWRELGAFMLELGCRGAVNLDGGGSSVMGLAGPDGQLRVVNSPSSCILGIPVVRPLPVILTLQKTEGVSPIALKGRVASPVPGSTNLRKAMSPEQ